MSRGRRKWKTGFTAGYSAPVMPPDHMANDMTQLRYPARTNWLVEQAITAHLSTDVVHVLKRLPDCEFRSPEEVMQVVAEVHDLG
jgi:hypothetical protein